MLFEKMRSEFQEVQDDDILAAFDIEQNYDYENELRTRISIDMSLVEDENDDNMTIEKADHLFNSLTSYAQRNSMEDISLKQTSNEMVIHLSDAEDVVDVEEYSFNTEDLRKLIKNEDENIASSKNAAEVIKLEDDDFDVEIIWPDLEDHVIDITHSGDEQDVIDVDEDLNIDVKTEAAEVSFQWDDMVKGIIDLSDSEVESDRATKVKTEGLDTSFSWNPMIER